MRLRLARPILVTLLTALGVAEVWATCGGGGGGGTGGMGSGMTEEVYQVPWKGITLTDKLDPAGLVVYWFPKSQNELEHSSLRNSRALTLYSAQCVTLGVADSKSAVGEKFASGEELPVAVLAQADGKILGKAVNKDGFLRVAQVEKLVESEVKQRENVVKDTMKQAKEAAKKDKDAAIAQFKTVVAQQCLFPNQAKDAVKELKKLGVNGTPVPDAPIFDNGKSARIEHTMRQGLTAENHDKYEDAIKFYADAHRMDPADAVPLRYLGEAYRHHTGDWDKAREVFTSILAMPADPLSRAVALHGLGKMTIHDGDFKKGLGLMEDSVKAFPLALAYRNLAVYWNSEGDTAKRDAYTAQAVALAPTDPFNIVFAAAFLPASGRAQALKVAADNDSLLCASYNLAAIYAQAGQKDKALAYLKRHFYEYERYPSVRSKEMMEARVDAVFASILDDPAFMSLTADADGKLGIRKH